MTFTFTFGSNHKTRDGVGLGQKFVNIEATNMNEAKAIMAMTRGRKWSNCYLSESDAGVARYELEPIPLGDVYLPPSDAPRPYDSVLFRRDDPARRPATSVLRKMADMIEEDGSADDVGFAVFEFDAIDESKFECLDTFDNYDDALVAFTKLSDDGRNVQLQLDIAFVNLVVKHPVT